MAMTPTLKRLRPAGPPPRLSGFGAWCDRRFKWLLVAPAVALILALSIYPLAFSLVVSFINYDFQVPGHAFVGLKNFERVVVDPIAGHALFLTAALSAACVAIEFALGLAVALAMVRPFPGRGLVMSILIVPLFISPVIVGQAWTLLLQRPFGPTNYVLGQILGREVEISWLTETPWLYISLVLADVWQWTPFMFVILLAGLTAIPQNLYEAAELDGVNAWQAFRAITLPHLAPMMLLAITFRLLDAIRMFDTIYIMTGGGPGTKTYTAAFYLYTVGFTQFRISQATAGSWLLLIVTALVVFLLVRRLLRTEAV
jgi:multiple sugar transport system permease protein